MEKIGFLCLIIATNLASFALGNKAESRQFSSKPFYVEATSGEDHVQFPNDADMVPEDLDTAASVERIQGLKFYAVQNGNIPMIIYPVTNGGATAPGDDDQHGLESILQAQATQPDSSNQKDFDESLKNVAQGFIFPSSPATSHEEIFKQLLAAGSQGPASEPYVIPTPKKKTPPKTETIISIPQITQIPEIMQIPQITQLPQIAQIPQITHAYILEQPQVPVMAIYNPTPQAEQQIYIPQQILNEQVQGQQEANANYSPDINAIPVESLQNKPSHYHMVGPHLFTGESEEEPQKEQEVVATSPYREEPSKIPLHPPPPIKASTYGPPQTVHPSTNQPSRNYPSKHRSPSPPRSQYHSTKGNSPHSKGPPKSRPSSHGSPYRYHSSPHRDHGHHHHHHYHHDSPHHHRETSHHHHHHHKEPHYSRPPSSHRPYEVHETKSPPHHSRHPPSHSSSHKHPYTFHHPSKPSGGHSGSQSRPSSSSRPPNHHSDSTSKPLFRPNLQKGTRPYGPPKAPSHSSSPPSNSIGGSHPQITKAIFHSTHSPDLTVNQNSGPIKDHHGYTPGRYEYDSEASATAQTTPSYISASHDSRRPPDASPSASISEPYVTTPPRPAYSDEDDEETSPKVEVYNPQNDNFYGADSYQRIKEPFKPPVIVYKGVRPPVRVYQKPETGPPYHHLPGAHQVRGSSSSQSSSYSYLPAIDSTWANHNTASTPYYHQQRVRGSYSVASPSASSKSSDPPPKSIAEEIHITTKAPFQYSPSSPSLSSSSSPTDSLSSSSDDSSSWTPINAPAGAVPARAYHIPAPDLSRGGSSQPINHHSSYYSSANARADDEDLVLTEQNSKSNPSTGGTTLTSNNRPSGTGSSQLRRENNSEEVVSAVVLVKHR
ncbi:extensin-like [Ischnura elegans]|uniref:extensin-like n=1 Tax=Ischnura elegans TaxID=197161 RepID=UPI001ED883AB|nr:extensin-like [Ischnura elegans]